MANAAISSPELALSDGVSLGAVKGDFDAVNDVSDHFGVDGVIPEESTVLQNIEGKLPEETHQEYYIRIAKQIQHDLAENGEEIPGVTDMSPENLAKDLFLHDHPEVKAKMVEAAAMVNMYTNQAISPPEINMPAMDTAAQEVLTQAMNATKLEDIDKIRPEMAAAKAIDQHYYNGQYERDGYLESLAGEILERWGDSEHNFHKGIAARALAGKDSFGPDFKLEEVSMAHSVSPTNVGNIKVPSKGAAMAV